MTELSFTTAAARNAREREAAAEAAGTDAPPPPTIKFDVDGEEFEAIADAPGGALLAAAAIASSKSPTERLTLVGKFLDAVLVEESAFRFTQRLYGADRPIDLAVAAQIVARLMEVYGGRPTEPPSP